MPAVTARRPSTAARRAGYCIAAAINIVLLYLINKRPGWESVPFFTDDTVRVLALVNASLIAGLAVDVVQVVRDPPWLVALGGMTTTAIGTAVLVRMWQVFPLGFGDASFDWPLLVRALLAVGVIGSLIGFTAQAVALAGAVREKSDVCTPRPPGAGQVRPR
jgi:threonine/homoserine efflux transporter RhtA